MVSQRQTERLMKTGVPGFDDLMGGGLPPNRLYVLCGPPGSGKTTFSARVITEGAAAGEQSLLLTMHETHDELVRDMSAYDFGFEQAARSDRVTLVNMVDDDGPGLLKPAGSSGDSQVTNRVLSYIDSQGFDRVVIDSTMLLETILAQRDDDLVTFLSRLKQVDATVFLIAEMTDPTAYAREHYLAHGLVFFHNFLEDDGMNRGLQILKMRGLPTDAEIRPLEFTNRGVEVAAEGQGTP